MLKKDIQLNGVILELWHHLENMEMENLQPFEISCRRSGHTWAILLFNVKAFVTINDAIEK